MVEIQCDTEAVMKKSSEYFEQFNVVILTGCVMEVLVRHDLQTSCILIWFIAHYHSEEI